MTAVETLFELVADGDLKEVKKLIKNKKIDLANINRIDDDQVLMLLTTTNYDIFVFLLQNGLSVNLVDYSDETLLFICCKRNLEKFCEYLIKNGADLEAQDCIGRTPLFEACLVGNFKIVKMLVEKGANTRHVDTFNEGVLMLTACFPAIISYLIDHGADVNLVGKRGFTALRIACMQENAEIVKTLIENGVNMDNGDYLLLCAMQMNNIIFKMLIDNGTNINIHLKNGNTTLIECVKHGTLNTVKMVVENGADVNLRNKSGVSALYTALMDSKKQDIAKYLLLNGAIVEKSLKVFAALNNNNDDLNMLKHAQKANNMLAILHAKTVKGNKSPFTKLPIELLRMGVNKGYFS